jgi:hypothetical protein
MESLYIELTRLLNRHSAENNSDTPDFILARYLLDSLQAFENAVIRREDWYGRSKTENERLAVRREV